MKKGNPQLENGYTRIANELLEGILLTGKHLSKNELLITLAIIRQTYGFGKKACAISITQFQKLTGIHRRNVQRALSGLIYKELIERSEGAKMRYGQPVHNYGINKKHYSQGDYRTVVNMTTEPIVRVTPIKEIKKSIKERKKKLVDKMTIRSQIVKNRERTGGIDLSW